MFFRASTRQKAQELGLTGWVRNEPDGSVLAEAEGTAEALQTFIEWCKEGPTHANVNHVNLEWIDPVRDDSFQIRYA